MNAFLFIFCSAAFARVRGVRSKSNYSLIRYANAFKTTYTNYMYYISEVNDPALPQLPACVTCIVFKCVYVYMYTCPFSNKFYWVVTVVLHILISENVYGILFLRGSIYRVYILTLFANVVYLHIHTNDNVMVINK